jgi:hypothetical protein
VERPALDGGDAFGDELRAAFDEARLFGAVGERLARDVFVARLVGLAEIRGVRVGNRAVGPHPAYGGAGVQAARERDADLLSPRKLAQYLRQNLRSGKGNHK